MSSSTPIIKAVSRTSSIKAAGVSVHPRWPAWRMSKWLSWPRCWDPGACAFVGGRRIIATDRSSNLPESPTAQSATASEDEESGDGVTAQLREAVPTRSGMQSKRMGFDEATAKKRLEKLPPAEKLRKALEDRYDVSKYGGESPRAVATAVVKGMIKGNANKVVSAYDLDTKRGLLAAMAQVVPARIVELKKELHTTVESRFGDEGLRILAEVGGGDVQAPDSQDRWQNAEAAVADAGDSMEIYYTEDKQKALAEIDGKELIEMHQRDGRWYATASTQEAAKMAAVYGWIQLPIVALERRLEIAKKADSVEQLRQELAAEEETPLVDAVEADESVVPMRRPPCACKRYRALVCLIACPLSQCKPSVATVGIASTRAGSCRRYLTPPAATPRRRPSIFGHTPRDDRAVMDVFGRDDRRPPRPGPARRGRADSWWRQPTASAATPRRLLFGGVAGNFARLN